MDGHRRRGGGFRRLALGGRAGACGGRQTNSIFVSGGAVLGRQRFSARPGLAAGGRLSAGLPCRRRGAAAGGFRAGGAQRWCGGRGRRRQRPAAPPQPGAACRHVEDGGGALLQFVRVGAGRGTAAGELATQARALTWSGLWSKPMTWMRKRGSACFGAFKVAHTGLQLSGPSVMSRSRPRRPGGCFAASVSAAGIGR